MDLKELYRLENKRQNAIAQCQRDTENLSRELEKAEKELYETMGSEGVVGPKNEKLADKCINLRLRLDTAKALLTNLQKQKNPYYSDDDVVAGFSEYRKQANKKADAIIKEYNDSLAKTAAVLKKMYEHRIAARGVRREFYDLLEGKDKEQRFGPLETIHIGRYETNFFGPLLKEQGVDLNPYNGSAAYVFNSDNL